MSLACKWIWAGLNCLTEQNEEHFKIICIIILSELNHRVPHFAALVHSPFILPSFSSVQFIYLLLFIHIRVSISYWCENFWRCETSCLLHLCWSEKLTRPLVRSHAVRNSDIWNLKVCCQTKLCSCLRKPNPEDTEASSKHWRHEKGVDLTSCFSKRRKSFESSQKHTSLMYDVRIQLFLRFLIFLCPEPEWTLLWVCVLFS